MKMKTALITTWLSTLLLTRFLSLGFLWVLLFPIFFFVYRYGRRHELPNVLRVFLASSGAVLLMNSNERDLIVGTMFFVLSIFLNDEPVRHVWHSRGVIVVAGVDGSGKSTVVRYLTEWLCSLGFKTRTVKFSDYVFLNQLVMLKSRKTWRTPQLVTSSPADAMKLATQKVSKFSFLRPYFAFLDNLVKYLVFVVPFVWKDEFVICDRFIWNAFVKHAGLGYKTRFLFRLSTLIKPKCGFVLAAPYKVVAERILDRGYYHPEYSREQYMREKRVFKRLADKLGYPTVDTDKTLEQVEREVVRQVSRLSPKIRKEVLHIES